MTILDYCFRVTVSTEGGLSRDRSDRGNWTSGIVGVGTFKGSKYGVSAHAYPLLDIASLTLADARGIFERDYFDQAGCAKLPGPLAVLVADAAYNNGPGIAPKWLQQALGVPVDGMIGPVTLAAVTAHQGHGLALLSRYQAIRLRYMASLPGWIHNTGWADRLCVVLLAATQVPTP